MHVVKVYQSRGGFSLVVYLGIMVATLIPARLMASRDSCCVLVIGL